MTTETRTVYTPLIFTTAIPTCDEDLDKAVYITPMQFAMKERNGDFEETREENGILVGISKYIFTN